MSVRYKFDLAATTAPRWLELEALINMSKSENKRLSGPSASVNESINYIVALNK
jgi:hypothetical protein